MVNDEPNPGRWPLSIWSRPNVVNKTGKLLSTILSYSGYTITIIKADRSSGFVGKGIS